MDFTEFVDRIAEQGAAMRAAAIAAGPAADVPSCPDWTVERLVGHLAGVYRWTLAALHTDPSGAMPQPQPRPRVETFDDQLGWWDTARAELITELCRLGPDAPAWTIGRNNDAAFWARRQAHETAMHRLDAELAAGTAAPLVFDPAFAADGIDEFLTTMTPGARQPYEGDVVGTVLVHAADAGRAWLVAIAPGEPFTATAQPVLDADASVVGTADAVYRMLWGRPSGAVLNGDTGLVGLLTAP